MQIAEQRKALVTGAASGIGRAVARRLSAAGAAVGVMDINAQAAADVAAGLASPAIALAADATALEQVQAAVQRCAAELGGLDTLVISAGVFHISPLEQVNEAAWDRTIDVNLKGAFLAAQAAAPFLRESGRGRIVTIGSDCSRRGFPMQAAYCASKFGLLGLTESLAAELAPDGVTANCVCPVAVPSTAMGQEVLDWKEQHTARSREQIVRAAARTNALGRNATERDVADAVLFLISEQASFLTGVALDVDGGARLTSVPGTD